LDNSLKRTVEEHKVYLTQVEETYFKEKNMFKDYFRISLQKIKRTLEAMQATDLARRKAVGLVKKLIRTSFPSMLSKQQELRLLILYYQEENKRADRIISGSQVRLQRRQRQARSLEVSITAALETLAYKNSEITLTEALSE
jgi:hypothetical protein